MTDPAEADGRDGAHRRAWRRPLTTRRDETRGARPTAPRPRTGEPGERPRRADGTPPPSGVAGHDRLSHELRTPLNAILGYAELLLDGSAGPLSAQARECAACIQDAGRRLLDRVEAWHRRADGGDSGDDATTEPRP